MGPDSKIPLKNTSMLILITLRFVIIKLILNDKNS